MITDKSKADPIDKSLVCVQAGWLIVQRIARLAAGLPIILLELATLAHCLCALVMYALWWHKPLDITEPVLLDHPNIRHVERPRVTPRSFNWDKDQEPSVFTTFSANNADNPGAPLEGAFMSAWLAFTVATCWYHRG
jgi:hypothetical protein